MLPDCSKFPNRNFQMFGHVFHDIIGKPNSCGKLKILWYFLNEICYRIGNVCSFIGNRIWLCQYMRMTSRWRKKAEYGCHVEEFDEKCGYWRNHISSWSHAFGMHSTWMQTNETIIEQNTNMFESRILAGATENYRSGGILHTDGSVATWRACSKLCWTILWIGKQRKWSQLYKVPHLCLDDHQWQQEELESVGELSEVCSQSCLEMLLFGTNWTTWHLVVSEQACKDQSQTGFGHVTNDYRGWFLIFITRMIVVNVVTWGTRHSIADWVCSKS